MPRSTASWIRRAASSSVLPCGSPSRLKPPQPSPATLTLRPAECGVFHRVAAFLSEQTDRPAADRLSLVHRGNLATPARLELATLGLGKLLVVNKVSLRDPFGAKTVDVTEG